MFEDKNHTNEAIAQSACASTTHPRSDPEAQSRASLVVAAPAESKRASGASGSRWIRRIVAWGLRRARRLARLGRAPQALKVALRLANLDPSLSAAHLCVARIAFVVGDFDTGKNALHMAIGRHHLNRVKDYCRVAKAFLLLDDLDAASGCLEEAARAYPTSPRVWILLGELYRSRGNAADAACHFDRAFALAGASDDRLRALGGLAGCFEDATRIADANNVYRRMIDLAPDETSTYYHFVASQEHVAPSDAIVRSMIEMLESGRLGDSCRMNLHYALGNVFDRCQQYGEAFAHFVLANTTRSRLVEQFDEESLRKEVEARIQIFGSERIAELAKFGDQDDFLICIVGMPRSGTTLLEQILSSQPGVIGLGERLDFRRAAKGLQARLRSRDSYPLCCRNISPQDVRELSRAVRNQLCQSLGTFSRIVTKHPADCWDVGLIKILFPRAKIIHSRRHPIDTCLSCFMQNFKYVPYATQLYALAAVYRLYQRIMTHWRDVLSSSGMLECSYERIVSDPDPVVRGLHDFCELPYNEDWSTFWNHPRRVDTSSKWQVRRPIYRSSVQKWRNYAAFLGPLLELKED